MNTGSDVLALLGRVLLAVIFVYSGFGKITDFQGTVHYIEAVRMPVPQVLAVGAIVVEFIGGLALLIGFRARWAALAFVLFLIVITPLFHNFWSAPAAEAMEQQINFIKNVAIIGGMLMVMAFGPGRYSVDKD
ncbi:MAG TPA: DoxX family protein [Casimicrobiaceae bacterium]|nr:DoxX family protein [Casimicrobiaceae bacterium]